ncbi:unnamed protein product [Arctia plantaginis]|uniref:Uncharacterized protein n=1 Tax=Arctia plantaginis TaxID=874455 RepID=A0A8S1AMK9_ARCPL|nr:unnamed protein product [Arctia plantaginis]
MAVIGRPWHAYYTWNQQFRDMCLKTIFKVPNNMNQLVRFLKQKFYGLHEEPIWSKAELLMYMGDCKQIVLFRDRSGVHGQFDGLPCFKRDDFPHEIPLRTPYKITIKVIERGKYLLISDCTTGITFLLLHPEERPPRVEIEAFAAKFNFGDMYPACTKELDPVINNVTEEDVTEVSTTSTKKYSKYDW